MISCSGCGKLYAHVHTNATALACTECMRFNSLKHEFEQPLIVRNLNVPGQVQLSKSLNLLGSQWIVNGLILLQTQSQNILLWNLWNQAGEFSFLVRTGTRYLLSVGGPETLKDTKNIKPGAFFTPVKEKDQIKFRFNYMDKIKGVNCMGELGCPELYTNKSIFLTTFTKSNKQTCFFIVNQREKLVYNAVEVQI